MPQAFGSSGAHMGVGRALFFARVTLLEVEAEETWVEATAPVRTRATTTARTMVFMRFILFFYKFDCSQLASSTHAAGIRIIGSAHGGREGAILRQRDLVGGGG